MRTRFVLTLLVLSTLSACGNSKFEGSSFRDSLGDVLAESEWPICTTLPFDNSIDWPSGVAGSDRSAFKLALNIISSYEGHDGWSSIANNFDGMGLSLGLFNQPLGVGNLQPLMLNMRDRYHSKMSQQFTAAHFSSLLSMLNSWAISPSSSEQQASIQLSHLDAYGETPDEIAPTAITPLAGRNSVSVSWATSTLYIDGGRTFKSDWKQELQNMASTPEYVSIQIEEALDLHQQAMSLYNAVGINSLRSYLLMFDFVVQNGGLYNSDLNAYFNWYRANPNATEKQRLYRILEIRLQHVRPEYVADVRARKSTIIEGTGIVHGSHRNLPSEYCFNNDWTF